jgi:ABC-2 type transport system permease protein
MINIKPLRPFFTLIENFYNDDRRILGQVILGPLVTASLYILVFGYILGPKISEINGINYISFVFPGILAMNIIISSFSGNAFGIFFMKWQKLLDDYLTLPLSYTELVGSLLIRGLSRALLLSVSIAFVAVLFGVNSLLHPLVLVLYILLSGAMFGLFGLLIGIWANGSFEKLNLTISFVLTPLSFLGGTFYSLSMLPENLRLFMYLNPIFYIVDGIRYSLTGFGEIHTLVSLSLLFVLSATMLGLVIYVFKTGWKLRS